MLIVCPAASRSRICCAVPATISPLPGVRCGGNGSPRPALGASGTVVAGEPGSLVGICRTRPEVPGPMEPRSQQLYPRMLRNFIRDRGTQFTLGAFVATFVYAVMALGSITNGRRGEFVPHISITVALVLMVADMGVLISFIHHIAESIQLPEVIAGIAADLSRAIDAEFPKPQIGAGPEPHEGPTVEELVAHIRDGGVPVPATESGYLQFVGYAELAAIAEDAGAVVLLAHRPGDFVVAGRPFATGYPPQAARTVAAALEKAHATGPHRTLIQ